MNQNRNLLLAFVLVIASVLAGHFFPPVSILLTPFVLPIVVSILCFIDQQLGLTQKVIASLGLIVLHDLGVKFLAGGINDQAGLAWIHLTLIIGLIAAYIPFLMMAFASTSKLTGVKRVFEALIYPLTLIPYYFLSANLGH